MDSKRTIIDFSDMLVQVRILPLDDDPWLMIKIFISTKSSSRTSIKLSDFTIMLSCYNWMAYHTLAYNVLPGKELFYSNLMGFYLNHLNSLVSISTPQLTENFNQACWNQSNDLQFPMRFANWLFHHKFLLNPLSLSRLTQTII